MDIFVTYSIRHLKSGQFLLKGIINCIMSLTMTSRLNVILVTTILYNEVNCQSQWWTIRKDTRVVTYSSVPSLLTNSTEILLYNPLIKWKNFQDQLVNRSILVPRHMLHLKVKVPNWAFPHNFEPFEPWLSKANNGIVHSWRDGCRVASWVCKQPT